MFLTGLATPVRKSWTTKTTTTTTKTRSNNNRTSSSSSSSLSAVNRTTNNSSSLSNNHSSTSLSSSSAGSGVVHDQLLLPRDLSSQLDEMASTRCSFYSPWLCGNSFPLHPRPLSPPFPPFPSTLEVGSLICGARCSWCHCHSLSLASVKSRLVLPFWYRLTRVVPDKGQLNGCMYVCMAHHCFTHHLTRVAALIT